jgi:protein-S-isoprenylcysteine O-methyltransferase Ste14
MSRLLRLYPRAWRDRYGEELAALLEDRPAGPFDVIDLVLGALDAHLHWRNLDNRLEHRKGIPMSLRLSGLAAIVGGGLWTTFFVIVSFAYSGLDLDLVWFPVVLSAGVLLLAALAGLSAFQFRDHPRWVWIAFIVPALGIGLVIVALARTLVTGDWSYDQGSPGAAILYGGLLLILIGSIVFAAVSWDSRGLRLLGTIAIAGGTLVTLPALLGALPPIGLVVGGLLFGGGWIAEGLNAVRQDRTAVQAR